MEGNMMALQAKFVRLPLLKQGRNISRFLMIQRVYMSTPRKRCLFPTLERTRVISVFGSRKGDFYPPG